MDTACDFRGNVLADSPRESPAGRSWCSEGPIDDGELSLLRGNPEPIIVIMGVEISGRVVAMYLPMFDMINPAQA